MHSALAQDAQSLEILIVDNCSTDSTWDVATSFDDPRLRCVKNESNLGIIGNFNRCLELCNGEYIRILCSDDQLAPGTIKREVALLDAHPEVALLCSPSIERLPNGRSRILQGCYLAEGIYEGRTAIANLLWLYALSQANPLNLPSAILMRARAVRQAGFFDGSFVCASDLEYWFRLLSHGDLGISLEPACEVSLHPHSESSRLWESGTAMKDLFELARRCRLQLDEHGLSKAISRHFAGTCYLHMVKAILLGRPRAARNFFNIPRRHGANSALAIPALLRSLLRRALPRVPGAGSLQQPRLWRAPETDIHLDCA